MKFLFVSLLLPLQLFAQDITGVWTGTLYSDTTRFIKYELAISEYNGKLSGYSHTIFVIDNVENIGVKSIKIKKVGKDFLMEDDKLIYNNYTQLPPKGIKQYSKLFLTENDTALVLSGPWKTNRTREFQGITGNIFLQKNKKINETLIIAKLESLGLTGSLSFMTLAIQSKDFTTAKNSQLNLDKPPPVAMAKDALAINTGRENAGIQQAQIGSKPEKQISGELNKGEDAETGGAQLQPAKSSKQEDWTRDVVSTGTISTKSRTLQMSKQPETEKEIQKDLNKDDHGKKEIIKVVSLPAAEVPVLKNQPTNSPSIKSESQSSNQQNAGKKMPAKVSDKDNSVAAKEIIKPAPIAELSAPKNAANDIITASQAQQISSQQKAGKELSGEPLNKDNGVNKDMIKDAPAQPGISTKNNESTNIVSIKSNTLQISKPQKAEKKIPALALKRDDSAGVTPVQAASPPAAEIATRKIETIRSVDIKSDSLLLTLYDNGEIDGDTVSVLLNGSVIMPRQGLMSKAINKTIYLTPEMGDSLTLIMYAENLGSIPPNTGLLVIHDGEDTYEIRFSGDLKKNSSIILRRRKEK